MTRASRDRHAPRDDKCQEFGLVAQAPATCVESPFAYCRENVWQKHSVGHCRLIACASQTIVNRMAGMFRARPMTQLLPKIVPFYKGAINGPTRTLKWPKPPQNVLIVKKPWNTNVLKTTVTFISHLHQEYPGINVIVTPEVAEELLNTDEITADDIDTKDQAIEVFTGSNDEIIEKTDLIVSLGGDGTILRGVSIFSNTVVPPVLSFSLGTLGFLLPFDFKNYKETFKKMYQSESMVIKRERIECHVVQSTNKPNNDEIRTELAKSIEEQQQTEHERLKNLSSIMDLPINSTSIHSKQSKKIKVHAMNDIVLHRGSLPGLLNLDIYINGYFLTRTTADGLILSTPTGSTAYSLSSGGSIVHPIVKCILLTPICPRSLSFRPLILPFSSHILIKVIGKEGLQVDYNKVNAKMSVDGIPQMKLIPGDEIHIVSESWVNNQEQQQDQQQGETNSSQISDDRGIWCVISTKGDWVNGINSMLGFNLGFRSNKDDR